MDLIAAQAGYAEILQDAGMVVILSSMLHGIGTGNMIPADVLTVCVDIHPAASIGNSIMLDHATGIVVGETAVIEDDVSILHSVTLGGTGKAGGDRHPKIRRGVLLAAGCKVIGNIEVGEGAKVGAGSVVLDNVPAHVTVAGVPAKVVGQTAEAVPSHDMNQNWEV